MKTSEIFPKKEWEGPSFEDVNAAALNVYPGLLESWFPAGRVHGDEFVVGNLNGDKGRSLSVNTSTGVWSDFGNKGDGGSDPVSLYAARYGIGQGEACNRLAGDLGLDTKVAKIPARENPAPKARPPSEWKPTLPAPCPPPHHLHHSRLGQPSQVWHYKNRDGQLLFMVCRFDKNDGSKDILPFSYGVLDGKKGWQWKAIPDQRPLYGLDRLQVRPQAKVILVEGEKTADAAQRLLPSLVAVTWPGGGKAAGKADWSSLKGREVLIWPDADKPGRETAEGWHTPRGEFKWGLAHYLIEAGAAVRVIEPPPNVKDGWDLADAEAERWDTERVVKWIQENMREASQPSEPEAVGAAETVAETSFETIQRLAGLPTIEYERCRKAEAKRLDMRASVLDKEVKSARPCDDAGNDLGLAEPEPWTEEVDGNDLLNRIVAGLRRHVVMPSHVAEAVALWCLHTYAFEAWQHTPRLAIGAPEKGCGKSLLLDVIACLVPRALQTDSLSEAVAFRLAESHRPVFLIDECDTHLGSKNPDDGLRGILNSGHAKGKRALRCVGDNNEVKGFNTFTPVVLAGIGSLPPTLTDRSIRIILHRRRADEHIENFRSDRADHLRVLASQATRWTTDNKDALRLLDPVMPDGLYNRRADVWRPLIAIADVAGGTWPERARQAAASLESSATDESESITVMLFFDIRTAFEQYGDDKMPSVKLAEYLNSMEDRPWPEYGRSRKPITTVQIARLLKRHTISPGTIRTKAGTPKGYKLESFKNVFARYLSQVSAATTPQINATVGLSPIPSRHKEDNVAAKKTPEPAPSLGCGVVAAENPESGVKHEKEPWQERI